MNIEVYYIKKQDIYLPCFFPQTEENNILEYFIRGKGYKKTKCYKKVEISIPDSIDNCIDIKETYNKYGKEICLEYLITNNAEYWKNKFLNFCIEQPLNRDELKLFEKTFNVELFKVRDTLLSFFNVFSFDIIEFDKILHKQGYSEEKHGSIKDYLECKYNKSIVSIIEKLLNYKGEIK